ncbi:MAG: DUF87 domain-containing protein [Methylococcales bacterium]|jgi:DNA segregation ATPase FtsK/SpoIIIE, S-DNA-T family|nr:DUF87 domain-containing protein [Methylococcales bacterium]MBT7442872.1 DUF87 domain-containing protein [Methylococcales bacterium]
MLVITACNTRIISVATSARIKKTEPIGSPLPLHSIKEGVLFISAAIALYSFISIVSYSPADPSWSYSGPVTEVTNIGGLVGAWLADITLQVLGYFAFFLPFAIGYAGYLVFRGHTFSFADHVHRWSIRWVGFFLTILSGSGLAHLHFKNDLIVMSHSAGGILGDLIGSGLVSIVSFVGATIFLLALFLTGLTLLTNISWIKLMDRTGEITLQLVAKGLQWWQVIVDKPAKEAVAVDKPQQKKAPKVSVKRNVDEAESEKASDDTPVEAEHEVKKEPVIVKPEAVQPVKKEPLIIKPEIPVESKVVKKEPTLSIPDEVEESHEIEVKAKTKMPSFKPKTKQPGELKLEPTFAPTPSVVSEPELEPFDEADFNVASEFEEPETAFEEQEESRTFTPKPVVRMLPQKSLNLIPKPDSAELPSVDLLDDAVETGEGYTDEELQALSELVEIKLADFGIKVDVVEVHPGPVITRFEIQPAPGIKVSRITNLTKDLARAMSVSSVRIVEVIPGKSTVGLEIPNSKREMVFMSEMINSKAFIEAKEPTSMVLGKDIGGVPQVVDMAKMPHLLIAGTTGSGKSVGVNVMILSLLYKSTAEQVRLIMIDPKMLELSVYNGIPHLLTPVVTDMKEAANALRWCVAEMERRYRLMSALGVRNIIGYNDKVKEAIVKGRPIPDPLQTIGPDAPEGMVQPTLEHLPYIVVVVDELADMMMVVGKKVEELIARLAQKARACGIHLILATQRPSVDVLTGLIKANVPSRIAFQVSSKIDSRTVIDQMGAESLLGHGDMLYLSPGGGMPTRIHGAFVDDHEVHEVVNFLKGISEPNYLPEIGQEMVEPLPGGVAQDSGNEKDVLYDQAVRIVTETRKASISGVQRRLKIGYNRAARIVEEMEADGVVSTVEPNGMREVLAPPPPPID